MGAVARAFALRRRRRVAAGRRQRVRIMRKVRGVKPFHTFKERVQIASITAGANNNTSGILKYQISDLTNWQAYQGLFDLYKITGVGVKLVPKWNSSDANQPGALNQMGTLPMLYIAPNRDPYTPVPANAADVLNDDYCKIIRLSRPVNLFIKSPKPDITNGAGSIPFQFGTTRPFQPWLTTGGGNQSVNQENVSHYGHRWYIANGNGNFECVVDVYLTYYFTMKESN